MSTLNSKELLQLYQDGQSEAATAIFDKYVGRLIALVGSRIGPKLRRRIDAEDVVQSAYRSFFVHAKDGHYQLARSGDLWRLLASVTLNKLYGQIEKQTAEKRSIDREEPGELLAASAAAPEPSAAEIVAIVEQLQLVINGLSPDERLVLTSRLRGDSDKTISESIRKSERTVRRLLAGARRKIEQRFMPNVISIPAVRLPVTEPQAPMQYSDYVLEQLVGSGGMGKVFRARETSTGKKVAIKSLHKSRQSDERAVRHFVQESQILAKLRHPNIVGVQGLGRFPGGGYFIVMDFVDGIDLQTRLDEGPLPLDEVVSIIKQVAHAIEYAHDNGIVHCDLKPGNVLLDKNDQVCVTDFGFAFLVVDASTTSANSVGGTAGYIAPEILRHNRLPTPAADIYGLGVLIWALTTGEPPDSNLALDKEAKLLASAARIVGRCLANDPTQRYQSPQELVQDLERL